MTTHEWREVAGRVRLLWGASRWEGAPRLYDEVRRVPYSVALSVVDALLSEGRRHAPTPAEVIGRCRAATPETQRTLPGPDECPHPRWGILQDETLRADGTKVPDGFALLICPICHIEREVPSRSVETYGEAEDRRLAMQERTP